MKDSAHLATDDQLLTIYLSGLVAGAATTLARVGVEEAVAVLAGRDLAAMTFRDPLIRDDLLGRIRSVLSGCDVPEADKWVSFRGVPE